MKDNKEKPSELDMVRKIEVSTYEIIVTVDRGKQVDSEPKMGMPKVVVMDCFHEDEVVYDE